MSRVVEIDTKSSRPDELISPGAPLAAVLSSIAKSGLSKVSMNNKTSPGLFFDQTRVAGYLRSLFSAGLEKPMGTPNFRLLRGAYEVSPIDRVIVGARQTQMEHICNLETPNSRNLGITVKHQDEDDWKEDTEKPAIKQRKMRALELLGGVNTDFHPGGFNSWMVAGTLDHLKIDRVVMIKQRNFRGHPISFHSIDATTVRPIIDVLIPYALKQASKRAEGENSLNVRAAAMLEGYQTRMVMLEQLSEIYGLDLTHSTYVQVINDEPVAAWKADEISVHITRQPNQMNRTFYGVSHFENSLEITDLWLTAWQYNKGMFNQEYPENMLILQGDYDEDSLEGLKQQLKTAGKFQDKRLAIVSADEAQNTAATAIKLREPLKDMAFNEMMQLCINLKCFKWSTKVETDQGTMPIGKIAVNKLPVKLKSFDRETGEIVWAQVTDWQVLPPSSDWVKITYPGGKKYRQLEVTAEHELWTQRGMVQARNLDPATDKLHVLGAALTPEQEQVILGGLLGDMSCRQASHVASMSESHSEKQRHYLEWKASSLANLDPSIRDSFTTAKKNGTKKYAAVSMHTKAHPVLNQFRSLCYPKGIKTISWEWLSRIDALGLAVWFMDDGNFTKKRNQNDYCARVELPPSTPEQISLVWRYFMERWGLSPSIKPRNKSRSFTMRFSVAETKKLIKIISPWVEPWERQVGERWSYRKNWIVTEPLTVGPTEALVPVKFQIEHQTLAKPRPSYDVTVEGTHTLFAQRCASKNCAAYRLDPTVINFKDMGGGQVQFQQAKSEEARISMAKEEGLHNLVWGFCRWLTREIVAPYDDELVVVPANLEREDEETKAKVIGSKKWATVDEMRAADQMPPHTDPEIGGKILSQEGIQIEGQINAMKQQEQGMEEGGGEEGGGGAPPQNGDGGVDPNDLQALFAGGGDDMAKSGAVKPVRKADGLHFTLDIEEH